MTPNLRENRTDPPTGRLRVLVLGHARGNLGGVGNFLRSMQDNLPPDVEMELFVNGHRLDERTRLQKLWRLAGDYVRFAWAMRKPWSLVHANPSLDHKSFMRELLMMRIARLFRRRYIIFIRGWEWPAFDRYLAGTDRRARFCQEILRGAERVVVLSRDFQEALAGVMDVSRVDIQTTMFEGRHLSSNASKDFASLRFLFMSRFLPAKRGDNTLRAFEEIAASHPDATLVMAGDGPDMENLKAIHASLRHGKERVRFAGYVSGEDKYRLLEQCNVFLMPTEHPEGMPNALLEAMGSGEIPMVTRAGGTIEAIGDGEYGIALASSAPELMVAEAERLAADPAAASAFSDRIRTFAWQVYEARIVCQRMVDIYRKAVGGARTE